MGIGLKGCLYEPDRDKGEGTEKLALEMEENGMCN
jgi:predicted small lipoprotein YifL